MPHSNSKNWIHLVFCTKHRSPYIDESIKQDIYRLLRQQLQKLKCPVECINGMPEHVHILFILHQNHALADVVKRVKGGSSYLINQSHILPYKFQWSVGYGAFSVSQSGMPAVRSYIQNQKGRHAHQTYSAEYARLLQFHKLPPP